MSLENTPPPSSIPMGPKNSNFWPETFLEWLEAVSTISLIVGGLSTAAWVFFEYRARVQEARVTQTLRYAERFENTELQRVFEKVNRTWFGLRAELARVRSLQGSEEQRKAIWGQFVSQVVWQVPGVGTDGKPTKGLVAEIDRIVDFFSELEVCIQTGVCDRITAESFFGEYTRRFYCLHLPFIERNKRDYDSTYGDRVRDFVQAKDLSGHEIKTACND